MPMPLLARLAAATVLLAASTSLATAIPFEDPQTGLVLDPPAPFVIVPATSSTHKLAVGVVSTSGKPATSPGNPYLCELLYDPVTGNAAMTQAEMNLLVQDPAWIEQAAAPLERGFSIDSKGTFELKGALGVEIVGTPKPGGPSKSGIFVSLLDTPVGRMTLNCATPAAGMPDALPALRAIRASITPPGRVK